jgi:geranylgeranyl diphosphate synthase type I
LLGNCQAQRAIPLGATFIIKSKNKLIFNLTIMTSTEQALKMLKKYQKEVNVLLNKYFNGEIKKAKKVDQLAVDTVGAIKKFTISGGKRLRPALLYYAYLASGGKRTQAAKEASLSIELIHSFLLIHDDIMDQDDRRHGVDTINRKYEKIAQRYFKNKDSNHFGKSMAIVIGDFCFTMANKALFKSDFKPTIVLEALNKLQDIVYEVIQGQIRDFKVSFRGRATEAEIMKIQEAKTAYYTFDGPIQLGCILARNKDTKTLKYFTDYSLAMGKAFQIRDDILGIFGDEKTIGKPVGSDIVEGKRTLLTNYIVKNGSRKEKKVMESLLGKQTLSKDELRRFRKIVENSGSLAYSKKRGNDMVKEALRSLSKVDFKNEEAEIFFRGIAEYIISREV